MFGIVCLICLGAKRIEPYRILVVEMNDWGRTNVGGRIAVIGQADNVVAMCSSGVSLRWSVGTRV